MATSIIKLYHDTQLTLKKNFKIDYIEDYLSSLSLNPFVINDFQYVKHALNLRIKLNVLQTYLDLHDRNYVIDYISIQNSTDSSPMYYFVVGLNWKSQSTIEFELVLDTINSFQLGTDGDYKLSERTFIQREHKDRFYEFPIEKTENQFIHIDVNYNNWELVDGEYLYTFFIDNEKLLKPSRDLDIQKSFSTPPSPLISIKSSEIVNHRIKVILLADNQLATTQDYDILFRYEFKYDDTKIVRKIDLYSENLTPTLYKNEKGLIQIDNLDWYLIYRNQNEPSESLTNPVDCFLCASEPIILEGTPSSNIITPSSLVDDRFYYFMPQDNFEGYPPTMTATINGQTIEATWNDSLTFVVHNGRLSFYKLVKSGNEILVYNELHGITSATLNKQNGIYHYGNELVKNWQDLPSSTYSNQYNVISINSIDRTSAKLIKIIKLPYCPYPYTKTLQGKYIFDINKWAFDSNLGLIRLIDLSTKFNNEFEVGGVDSPFKELWNIDFSNINAETTKNMIYESKLFHSDFYFNKMVYDSFSFVFKLEAIDLDLFFALENYSTFKITFTTTSTINSRFMFSFSQYVCPYYETEDYLVMPIARNNEITLFNQQYINYIRNGYAFDVKNKIRQTAVDWTSIGLSSLGAFISLLIGGPIGALGAVGFGVGAVGKVIGGISTQIQMEQNIEQKSLMLQNQATSIYGSDDVDLMSQYAKNRLKYENYHVSSKMREQLFNLFYYYGYIGNYYGSPVLYTRSKFNFIQADIDFIDISGKINNEMKNDIIKRYQYGLTIIHRYLFNGTQKWDINQQFENWEPWLL